MGSIEGMRRVLIWQGGTAGSAELTAAGSRSLLQRALRDGTIERVGWGRYALPDIADARRAAAQLRGSVSHVCAAIDHGWEVLREPKHVDVIVPRGRRTPMSGRLPKRMRVHPRSLSARELEALVTDPIRTVIDCARALPFGEALAIADSALRHRAFERDDLLAAAAAVRGPGARSVRRVAQQASPLAANCFESAVRALALDVPGLRVEPQAKIDLPPGAVFVDLADTRLSIVIEADSFAFHGTRTALVNDAERYNWLTVLDWRVLRITWEVALDDPALVIGWLSALTAQQLAALAS